MNLPGIPITGDDQRKILDPRWIDDLTAARAHLRRVDSSAGGHLVGRNGLANYEGIAIPYYLPGESRHREFRLRRDHPDMEYRDGKLKEHGKYLSPRGRGNMIYFIPGISPKLLATVDLPVIVPEGEFKTLALWRLANHEAGTPRFVPIGLGGVWNWKGTIGKTNGPDGDRRNVKGPISDLDRITWSGRKVVIAFDADFKQNNQVRIARASFAKELRNRGARVSFLEWDISTGKGIDDHLATVGPDAVLNEIAAVNFDDGRTLLKQLFTDTGNAERFVALHQDDVRYCHPLKAWLIFDGRRWARDESDQIRTLGKNVMIQFLKQAADAQNDTAEKFARSSLDSKRITNMLRESQADLAVSPAELDQHPDLLVFLNGTVNLRSGKLGPHDPEHFITKLIRFEYQAEAQCPLFLATLARLMGASPDASEVDLARADRLILTLKLCFGYTLTGHTSEKVVFILFGSGNNGKTTILSLFLKLLEEYAVLLQIDSLMVRRENNNSQADLADLRGARFVMTSETEEGQRLAEGKLKRITQGMGKIKAVRKYENPIEFSETHKLFIDANHKPVIRGTDAAIWNRIFTVPFTATITQDEVDRELQRKLLAEAEGILAWAVAGAVLWYCDGLVRPEEIRAAVEAYRAEMDQVGRFIDECCARGDGLSVYLSELYPAYQGWTEASGEHPITKRAFSAKLLENERITSKHAKRGPQYRGIGLRADLDQG